MTRTEHCTSKMIKSNAHNSNNKPSMAVISALLFLILGTTSCSQVNALTGDFSQEFDLTWGDPRAKILEGGKLLTLSLDQTSGSGFVSKRQYLFGKINMQIKLVPGNSAGTVTAYYMSSEGASRDEIDLEFLGNITGEPYTLHTNVYTQGKGDREQQFNLWFDPTKDFHSYSIVWTPHTIIFQVDNIPIREFKNMANVGVAFPNKQAMKIHSSIWNADQWATRGGLVKTDWSNAPFTASYRSFSASPGPVSAASWQAQGLDPRGRRWLRWVRKHHMIYDYCTDQKRFPQGLPPTECNNRFRV